MGRVVQKPEGSRAAELMGKEVCWLLLLAANRAEAHLRLPLVISYLLADAAAAR